MRAQIRTYPTAQFYNELNYLQGEFTALRKSTSKKKKKKNTRKMTCFPLHESLEHVQFTH